MLRLRPSKPVLAAGLLLIVSVCALLAHSRLSFGWRCASIVAIGVIGAVALQNLAHGYAARSLVCLEWLGGDRWVLTRGRAHREISRTATLARGSRRIGQASLLVFRRGVFWRWDRCWVLVLDGAVDDRCAARRLRARLTVDQATMFG